MKINTPLHQLICVSLVLIVPATEAFAQQAEESRSTRIFKAVTQNTDDLDPALIESELISAAQEEFDNQLKVFKPVSTQDNTAVPQNSRNGNILQPQSNNSFTGRQSVNNNGIGSPVQFGNAIPGQSIKLPAPISGNGGINNNVPPADYLTPEPRSRSKVSNRNGIVNQNAIRQVSMPRNLDQNMYETKSTPTIQTQIVAPKTINVNQNARFYIQANNIGDTNVSTVKLIATIPVHARFVSSIPQPTDINGQQYEFTLNSLNARENQVIQIDVMPTEKLPLSISTQIQIESEQRVAVAVQEPLLEISVNGPDSIQTGKTVKHEVIVKNIGDGVAEEVRISTQRSEQLEASTDSAKTLVPKLVPGQVAKFELSSFATTAGTSNVVFQVTANGIKARQATAAIRVIRPELGVQILGPSQNYIGRDGVYTIQLQNSSEMPITGVGVQLAVPNGLQVDTISQQAKIDANRGVISWFFESIPGNQQQVIQFRAKAVTAGNQICEVNVQTRETASRSMTLQTQVMGRADLSIRVTDSGAPVGIGSKSDFSIELVNHGSQAAEDVSVRIDLPAALMPVNQPDYSVDTAANSIIFNGITVEPGQRRAIAFKVVAVESGEHVVRGTVSQRGSSQSISSENSIFVFESENAKVSEALVPDLHR